MPTYEYQCRGCPHTFEASQAITADPLSDCPACKKPLLHRKIGSGGAVIFKGDGFFCNDYAKDKKGAPANSQEGQ